MPRDKLDISMAPGAATGRPDGERWLSAPFCGSPQSNGKFQQMVNSESATPPSQKTKEPFQFFIATARTIFYALVKKNNSKHFKQLQTTTSAAAWW